MNRVGTLYLDQIQRFPFFRQERILKWAKCTKMFIFVKNRRKWKSESFQLIHIEINEKGFPRSYPHYPHKNICFWWITRDRKKNERFGELLWKCKIVEKNRLDYWLLSIQKSRKLWVQNSENSDKTGEKASV